MSSRKAKSSTAGVKRPAETSPERLVSARNAPLSASAIKKQRQTEAIANKVQQVSSLPTPLLAAWLERFVGFKEAMIGAGEGDRQLLITWAVSNAKKVPSYEEALAMWRKTDLTSAAPPPVGLGNAGPSQSHKAPADEEQAAAATSAPAKGPAGSSRRSLEAEFAAGDDADPASAMDTGDDGALEPGQCTHCFCVTPSQKTNRFKCEECGLVSGKPEDSAVNAAIILKQNGGSAASGKSNKDDSAPAVPKLSAVDKELTRLAEEGEPFARFDDKTPVSAETALHDIRESWCGRIFAHPSPALVKYIQSGKLKEPGFAVPRSSAAAEEARSREAQGHVVRITGDGLTTGATIKFPPVGSARALMDAFVGTIGPALFDRPRALLDWFMLVRTVLALDARRGWDAANHYLTTVLADNVPDRQPFGVYQERIAEHGGLREGSAPSSSSSVASVRSAAAPAPRVYDDSKPSACRNWNKGGCTEPCSLEPKRDHVCMWKACSDSSSHRGADCKHAPASFATAPRSGGAGAARPRGARGGAGGRGASARPANRG